MRALTGYVRANGYPPTLREMGAHMGIRSTNCVNDHLVCLEMKGFIRRTPMASRAIALVTPVNVSDARIARLTTLADRLEAEAQRARLGRRPDVARSLSELANEARLLSSDLAHGRAERAA